MKLVLALATALFWATPTTAQLFFPPSPNPVVAVCGGYIGPGDLGLTYDVWAGIRAYSGATCGTKSIQVTRASDLATQDINSLSTNGNLDMASAASFAGTDATCTGTIASTTLSVSSCSGTLHLGDPISGVGINPPAYITVIGTCASPPGTCTINASQTVAVAETITAQVTLRASKVYDKSGTNFCASAPCDFIGAGSVGADLIPNCLNSATLPCLWYIPAASTPVTVTGTYAWPNQPFTLTIVAKRVDNFTTLQPVYGQLANNNTLAGFSASANTAFESAGTNVTQTASDSTLHALQFLFNTTSSTVNVDNTISAASTAGTTNIGTDRLYWGQNTFGSRFSGYTTEFGFLPSAVSTLNQTALCHNERLYWGTPGSC
jgi:hypothetical protein